MAWIVLLASLAVTFFAWHLARGIELERANDRFVFRTKTIESALRKRLHACAFLLQSGAGLFAGSREVTRAEWQTYVTALQIDKHYPGVQGLGFSKRILPAEKKAHIRQIREEGFPDYDIHPDGARPEYTSIIFLEPFDWRNQRAFGYDMFSEPTRKEAMEMARDTGSAALSGKITLLQETEKDVQAGFLMYLPVYRNGEVAETPEQRREALTGYVYSPFRMNDFMQGLLIEKQEYVEIQIFDGDEPLPGALLYPSGNMESLISHSSHVYFATCQSTLEYAGRRWLLVFNSSPYFEETIDTGQVNSLLLLGIIISLLLFFVVLSLTNSRNQALSLANMTLDLEKANLGLRREIEERKQSAQAFEEAELRFKSIFNAAMDGILVADTQTKTFVMGNSAICDMLGYQLEELICLGIEDIHPAEAFHEVLQQFERQAKGEIRVTSDLPMKRKDGSVFYVDISTTSMTLAGRSLLVGIFHDVTERKQSEEKIRKLNDELEKKVRKRTKQLLDAQEELVRKEKLALLGQVVGSVGHELRNPLAVMNNAVYFLQTVLADGDESTREYLEIIQDGVVDAERIVADLLDSVRTKPPQLAAIGIGELIDQTLRTLTVPDTTVVTLDLPETLSQMRVDGRQMQQVFRNLINNGVEAMPEGGTLAINAVANSREGTVSVSVGDTGCGMPPEVLDNLFQPLITTKACGIGLGLVVVKNLTEANGGTITVESAVGQGTTFTVVLPMDNPEGSQHA
jgi:PAS domain S-box-containing protein